MLRAKTTPRGLVVAIVTVVVTAGCAADGPEVAVPRAGEIPQPVFLTRPADLADSPQLDALQPRETAGLGPTSETANGALLPDALAALATIESPPDSLTRVAIYDENVLISFNEDGIVGRSVTAVYSLPYEGQTDQTPRLSISEPSYNDAVEFPLADVVATVPAELGNALSERFPLTRVYSFDLDVSGSYGFGLVWNIRLEDARGSFATVFAELDGSIVAIDGGQ